MSTALIRGNMLTQLANRGKSASEEIDHLLREFLADKPGAWMPEDFFAPFELVERSIDDATGEGKHLLLRMLHQLVSELFVEMGARKLNDSESRQLLGAMKIIGKYEMIRDSKYLSALEFATKLPALFWSRISVPPEIVSDREKFIQSLIGKLPKNLQTRIHDLPISHENIFDIFSTILRIGSRRRAFRHAYFSGEAVAVEMILNGEPRKSGMFRINDRAAVFIDEAELDQYADLRTVLHIDLGEFALAETSARNIATATLSRFNDSLEEREDRSFSHR